MAEITEALTRQIAHLARLELSDTEVSTFTSQIANVLNYIDQLQKIDVAGIEPMTHPLNLETPMRDDVVVAPLLDANKQPKILQSAPDEQGGAFKVPQII